MTPTGITTPVSSDSIALEIDGFQYEYGEGPCLDAITLESMLYADDLASDLRWPKLGPVAVTIGMRSLLSCRLSAEETLGSLNLYARSPQAYGSVDRTKALIFATHAAIALSAAVVLASANATLDTELRRSENLQLAFSSREVIGQAEGILIERERITPEQNLRCCATPPRTSMFACVTWPSTSWTPARSPNADLSARGRLCGEWDRKVFDRSNPRTRN